jgi:hypothetical protein
MQSARCTFIRMTVFRCSHPSPRFPAPKQTLIPEIPTAHLAILFALLVVFSSTTSSWAKTAKVVDTATLVETASYIPCGDGCSLTLQPARAFCFKMGDEYLVGEGRSYLHEGKFAGFEDLAGKQLPIRLNRRFLWVKPPDHGELKIERGSLFEGFKTTGCVAEVHRPILHQANSTHRPVKVPSDAIAIAGPDRGEFRPLYLWFQCGLNAAASTLDCREWYKSGETAPPDWYCARTVNGDPVPANFALDPLLSQAGKLVLQSGAALQHDNRARTNGILDRPAETCR